ncbi:PHP domain-containing protein [Geomesophilobacter sediminis]|uniref:PHP domain-containing protein n=1 Tax=Geomesophilobacter sediminis TaxID=2798584 RepID=A0A8J7JMJ4_9BACT|nr:PHP domain-containing protein [Geomesophilobacter sediminis]MBJ6726030.1 PHP domain-containing protein [Geomesophilobacter sediminis]
MKLIADLHTHTLASGHAYSTVNELAQAAAAKNLLALGISDHGPAMPGGPHRYHFCAMRFIPKEIAGVRILRGIEANIIDPTGRLDLAIGDMTHLDYVIAGIHDHCGFPEGADGNIDLNTRALLAAMEHPRVKYISHPGNPEFPVHYRQIVEAAKATGTALEINNSSLGLSRVGSAGNCLKIARLCAEIGAPVAIGSDAHIAQGVGVFEDALKLVRDAGIAEEQVINSSLERLLGFLGLEA